MAERCSDDHLVPLTVISPGGNGQPQASKDPENRDPEMIQAGISHLVRQTDLGGVLSVGVMLLTAMNLAFFILQDTERFRTSSVALLIGVCSGMLLGILISIQSIVAAGIYFKRKAEP